MFSQAKFDAQRDIAEIILNRWGRRCSILAAHRAVSQLLDQVLAT